MATGKRSMLGLAALLATAAATAAPRLEFVGEAELFQPGKVSDPASDQLSASAHPSGTLFVYGCPDCIGSLKQDVMQLKLQQGQWASGRAPISRSPNESLPSFSRDGYWVYYVSDRPGGFGGTDLFRIHFTTRRAGWGTPENVGGGINSPGDEGAATANDGGTSVIFASSGRKGARGWDLFRSERENGRMGKARGLSSLNTGADEFDPTLLADDVGLVFARSEAIDSKPASLWFAPLEKNGKFGKPVKLDPSINAPGFSLRSPVQDLSDTEFLFFSRKSADDPAAKYDIYRMRYRVVRD